MINEKALGAFIGLFGDINDQIDTLKAYINDHMSVLPENVNWGHVGSAQKILALLAELNEWIDPSDCE